MNTLLKNRELEEQLYEYMEPLYRYGLDAAIIQDFGVLEFLHRLPLQIVIAAPPDKIQYIGPKSDQTLLVMTDEKVSYVEEYYNESIRQAYS